MTTLITGAGLELLNTSLSVLNGLDVELKKILGKNSQLGPNY